MNKLERGRILHASRVLEVATYAGRLVLENGGETYRVEDTVQKICEVYGYKAECFATLTGIISSIRIERDMPISLTERIKVRTTNLNKIHKVNTVVRTPKNIAPDQLMLLLKRIDRKQKYREWDVLMAHSLGAGAFTLMFNGSAKDFLGAFFIGGMIYVLKKYCDEYEINSNLMDVMGGSLASLASFVMLKLGIIDSLDLTTIGSIMLLVPGMAITNAIRDIFAGDLMSGIARGAEALLIATALALGSGIVLSLLASRGAL